MLMATVSEFASGVTAASASAASGTVETSKPFGFHTDRRTGSDKGVRRCRLCWRAVYLSADDVEAGERYPYMRCPYCGGAFPVRRTDAELVAAVDPKARGELVSGDRLAA
jgi:DNA-directed RNA polymerase subunit RPC12/RpoP